MPEYKFYDINQLGRITGSASGGEFGSDDDAIGAAVRLLSETSGIEVWDGNRLVCRIPPKDGPKSSPRADRQIVASLFPADWQVQAIPQQGT